MNKISVTIFSVFFMFILFSCKKYSEGPRISVRTKTERVCNKWKIVTSNNLYYGIAEIYSVEFNKNGAYIIEVSSGTSTTEFITGTWKFEDQKEKMVLYMPAFSYRHFNFLETYDTVSILKLKEKELWYTGNYGEQHLLPY